MDASSCFDRPIPKLDTVATIQRGEGDAGEPADSIDRPPTAKRNTRPKAGYIAVPAQITAR